jgi:hypothetical protein
MKSNLLSTCEKKKKNTLQKSPFIVPTNDGKLIEEHHELASTTIPAISIAHLIASAAWAKPFQTLELEEYTFFISGKKQFILENEVLKLGARQSMKIEKEY